MLQIQIDENEVREEVRRRIAEQIQKVEAEKVFWDAKELQKRTCMCWNTIQKEFFHDPRFPKAKIGSKWYFPAEQAREFLIRWLQERAI
jgi:hypothetical protein